MIIMIIFLFRQLNLQFLILLFNTVQTIFHLLFFMMPFFNLGAVFIFQTVEILVENVFEYFQIGFRELFEKVLVFFRAFRIRVVV
jgi:hypothetical protein